MADKEKQREYSRRWYRTNKTKHRAATRRHYAENREEISAREKRRYKDNRSAIIARARVNYLRREYGLSPADYDQLLIEHSGRCAICETAATKLVVDHDHAAGHLRGLLCSNCNVGLGHFKDDPARLTTAIRYLEEDK